MRRALGTAVLAGIFALVAVAPVAAQSLWIAPEVTFPTGDFGEFANSGWNVASGLNFAVGESGAWIGPAAYYGSNNHETDGESTDQFGVLANVGKNFSDPGETGLFIFGNAGYGSHKFKADGAEDETDWGPFLGAGAGLSVPGGDSGNFFFGGRYFHGLGDIDGTSYFSVFAGYGINIGGDDGM